MLIVPGPKAIHHVIFRLFEAKECSKVGAKVREKVLPIKILLHDLWHLSEQQNVFFRVDGIVVIFVPNIEEVLFHVVVEFLLVSITMIELPHYSIEEVQFFKFLDWLI